MSVESPISPTNERRAQGANGVVVLLLSLALLLLSGVMVARTGSGVFALSGALALFFMTGLYSIQPNQAMVVTLFGAYQGTDRHAGLRWVLPWKLRRKISLRVRNVTSEMLKVNDKRGNPIEIAANIVWHVSDTARASFDVDDYQTFINIQIETGLREVAQHYAYDHVEDAEPTLRANSDVVGQRLKDDLQERVAVAGLTIDEAHLMHLAYAPEIAGAMLRRQQAEAILSARRIIVSGAVGMVETALEQLSERNVVVLDDERRAAMVSNLLVVLCADREAQPVVNAGSLYG